MARYYTIRQTWPDATITPGVTVFMAIPPDDLFALTQHPTLDAALEAYPSFPWILTTTDNTHDSSRNIFARYTTK